MVDNTEVKNGKHHPTDEKCTVYCDFCDWLGDWEYCPVYKKRG